MSHRNLTLLRVAFAVGSLNLLSPLTAQFGNQIVWNQRTLTLIQSGAGYGRMVRLPNGDILCSYIRGSNAYVKRSRDEGVSWQQETQVAQFPFGNVANPELLVLQNGWVLLSYNERPNDGTHVYSIRTAVSKDNGATWERYQTIYQAGTVPRSACWEPAQSQLPSGEIQLFFSNEKPYLTTNEQEITLLRSFDDGLTWSAPQTVSFRAGHRDGMPVPLILRGQNGMVFSIEDNGLAGPLKPAIIYSSLVDNWMQSYADGNSVRRWAALPQLPASVYAGAPYIRQFPSGETILSVQSGEGRMNPGTADYSQMTVYIGDSNAANFANRSVPFSVPPTSSGLWNSLFIKNATTVTAISQITSNGVRNLWAIDGVLAAAEGPKVTGVANGASGTSTIASGSWVSVYGTNLSSSTRIWQSSDFLGMSLPTQLDGVRVAINGKTASVYFISPGQLNVQAPGDTTTGPVSVQVTNSLGTATGTVDLQPYSPGFFTVQGKYVSAVHPDGTYVAPVGYFGPGTISRPAQPGETILLYGTGFGPTTPAVPPGQIVIGAAPVSDLSKLHIAIGGVQSRIRFAGVVAAGEYQINVVVPPVSGGDQPIMADIEGATSQAGLLLSMSN